MRRLRLIATVFAWGLLSIGSAQSAVLINAFEDSGDVTFSGSGSLILTGLIPGSVGINAPGGFIEPSAPNLRFSLSNVDLYQGVGSAPFGSSVFSIANLVNGDNFGIDGNNNLAVPHQYGNGDLLSFSMTFQLATFASLGLVAGTYVWNLPNDTITLVVGDAPNPVPLPAALPLFASVLLGGGLLAWRKRKAKAANA